MRAEMVRAYVETLLEELIGSEKVTPDHDGDYPVRYKSALYFVRLIGDTDPVVQVFSRAVTDLKGSAKLYERLNEINATIRFARIFYVAGQVLVESDLIGQTVDREEFDAAARAVATITDHFGPLLVEAFGGRTAFADDKDGEAPPVDTAKTGQYL